MTPENQPESFTEYDTQTIEKKWQARWLKDDVYKWDQHGSRANSFVIDTPPPTVSGSLHIGHVFSYAQTDFQARFERMRGKNVFYPMGWDDNGLPTERRVENVFNIRCDAKQPYQAGFQPEKAGDSKKAPQYISRQNFIEACNLLTQEDEEAFKRLFTHLALSVDWSLEYATINSHCRRISQLSFLDLVQRGQVYSREAPTFWDVTYQTAVAQAELEDREVEGYYHDLCFHIENAPAGADDIIISTTRPELLAACIAVVAHPDDARYQQYFGAHAITPLFGARVPILASEHADPAKGTGILMVCTFGDNADVDWWKKNPRPIRQIMGRDGKIAPVRWGEAPFFSVDPQRAERAYSRLVGASATKAREIFVGMCREPEWQEHGKQPLRGELQRTQRAVKFYERGKHPIEIITTRQWFVKIMDHKEALVAQGRKIAWHPEHMASRYEHWVEGINQDWCISRQRYFGVPFPVWYPIDSEGKIVYEQPIYADSRRLPVDPTSSCPDGYAAEQRGKPGGFYGEMDVMDTWATSSLTPQISSHWGIDPARHASVFPNDLRPQSHEIIRTWAFYSIVKAYLHENKLPWTNIAISGWILDPDRKKMSKSKGNVVTPEDFLRDYSADAVRYWAARARLGVDTTFDEKVFKMGKKLTTKVVNAARFVLPQLEGTSPVALADLAGVTVGLDRVWLAKMVVLIRSATDSFAQFDYATALKNTEDLFWNFCDHYLEMVKARVYRGDEAMRRSARVTLDFSLKTFVQLFAPIFPYLAEEVHSWRYAAGGQASVHSGGWPDAAEISATLGTSFFAEAGPLAFDLAREALSMIRGVKSANQKKLKWPITHLTVRLAPEHAPLLRLVQDDLLRAGNIDPRGFTIVEQAAEGEIIAIEATLGEEEAEY